MDANSIFQSEMLEEESIFNAFQVFIGEIVSSLTTDKGNLVISKILLLTAIQMRTFVYDYAMGVDKWQSNQNFDPFKRQIDLLSMTIVAEEEKPEKLSDKKRSLLADILKQMQRVCLALELYQPKDIVSVFGDTDADYRTMMINMPKVAFIVVGMIYLSREERLEVLQQFWDSYNVKKVKKEILERFGLKETDEEGTRKRKRPLQKDSD